MRRILGATPRAGPPAAASHGAAAHLWDLRRDEATLEITVPSSSRSKPRSVTVHRSVGVDANHFTWRHGIPVTKPARTIVDIAAVVDRCELTEIVDQGRVGPALVAEVLDSHPLGGARPESVLEPVMAALLRQPVLAGRVTYQHEVRGDGRPFRIDFAVPCVKLAIEVLGLREHGTRAAVVEDSERRRLLAVEGWQVLEYTERAMTRSPTRVAREIAAVVRDRERVLAALAALP